MLPQFLSGDPHSDRVRVRYFSLPNKKVLWANAWYGPGAEGPPAHAHGGSIAALMDEAMGGVAWLQGHRCLALEITVKFRKALPLGTLAQIQSQVEKIDGKKIYSRAKMNGPDGALYAESHGLFLELEDQAVEQFLQQLQVDHGSQGDDQD